MTEIERAKQEIKEAQEKLQAAQDRLARAEKKSGWEFWMPKDIDEYFYIDSCGYACGGTFNADKADIHRIQQNNIFKTEQDAEQKLRIETKLREIAGDVDYSEVLYVLAYDRGSDSIVCDGFCSTMFYGNILSNNPYFYKKAVEQIGMNDLKWFYSYGWRRV